MSEERSEQEIVRREKLAKLREIQYPYPNDTTVNATSRDVAARATAGEPNHEESLVIGGRLMTVRVMGKASFCHLQDRHGRVQIYVRRDDVGEEAYATFKHFDLGDIVEVEGYPFLTKTGEPSLHARKIRLLVKCLHPLPEKWHGLTDIETRYRQRYLDLMVNPEVQEAFRTRAQVVRYIRQFFDRRDYVEVETPMMHQVLGGANARPFTTHHNTLELDLYLRIALELPLKRLVVGGLERVYEIGKAFRNEGIDTEHNPEFTMIEFYEAYATYETLIELTENLIVGLCQELHGKLQLLYAEKEIDLTPPWPRLTMVEAIYQYANVPRSIDLFSLEGVHEAQRHLGIVSEVTDGDYGKLIAELFDSCSEKLIRPVFITRHPLSISPLARPARDDLRFVDRFELYIAGMEMANAFSELNDPEDQLARFNAQVEAKKRGDQEAMEVDEDFVCALEYGLPPTAGEGIGIDRLVMLMTGLSSIRDVILFPQMRPHAEKREEC